MKPFNAARGIVYLAAPYSNPDASVRQTRYDAVNRKAAEMIEAGHVVFSPISMTHPIDGLMSGPPGSSDYWIEFDRPFMDACSSLVVLTLDGWMESSGVRREIAAFRAANKPVEFVSP